MNIAPAVVVHGGAGDLEPERADDARAGCQRAVEAALVALASGGSAVDAAVAAVRVLEDDPIFNAGTGAALTRAGTIECDAAVMDGATRRIGAVASMRDAGDAIAIARAVLDDGEHVLLCGEGAWEFARERGFRAAEAGTLVTERQRRRWEVERERRGTGNGEPELEQATGDRRQATGDGRPGGTVGACVVDGSGHVAAATSTGGTTYKRVGRIGDTPLAGCGTYADDEGGAASATGVGEAIIRVTMTRVSVDAMRAGRSASEAAWIAVDELARVTSGTAGIICCDATGRLGVALSTPNMSFGAGRIIAGSPHLITDITLARAASVEDLLR